MKISKVIETPAGPVKFEGELSTDELEVVIATGLNFLLQQGALPFKVTDINDVAKMQQETDTIQ